MVPFLVSIICTPVLLVPKSVGQEAGTAGSGSTIVSDQLKTDDTICRLALSSREGDPFWDGRITSREAVSEARRRRLTPEVCAKLLGRQAVQVKEATPKEGNVEERLTKLKNLYDKGLITKEEYENKQAEILEGLQLRLAAERQGTNGS